MKKSRDSSNELVEKLYREHGQLVMGIARKILRDEHLADDACQLTFISIAQNLYKLPENPGEIRMYISKTARNTAFDLYRKYSKIRQREVPITDDENSDEDEAGYLSRYIKEWSEESFEDELIDRLDLNAFLREYEELDYKTYTFIKEYYCDELSIKEISEIHNMNEETTRKRIYRGLCKIKKYAEKKGSV